MNQNYNNKTSLLTEFDEERDWKIIGEGFRELGREEGIKEEKKSIIGKLFSKGKSKEDILDLLDISEEEYEKLIN